MRILFNGKSDLLKSEKNLKSVDDNLKNILDKIGIGDKTSGWVSNYLDCFFQAVTQMGDSFSEKNFARYLEDESRKKKLLEVFEKNFFELYSLMEILCDIINKE